jgi:hypothetical protein
MKAALLLSALLATIPVSPPGPQPERVDISGKPFVELVGTGAVTVRISNHEDRNGVEVSFRSGASAFISFKSEKLEGMFLATRTGSTRVLLLDDDGDGLPEVRQTFEVAPDGKQKLVKIERLEWSSRVVTK